MTKLELFDYVQRYNNVLVNDLVHTPEISYYDHNYYQGDDEYILYGESDDDNCTDWYLCNKQKKKICYFGESFVLEGDIIHVFNDISYIHFYNM